MVVPFTEKCKGKKWQVPEINQVRMYRGGSERFDGTGRDSIRRGTQPTIIGLEDGGRNGKVRRYLNAGNSFS